MACALKCIMDKRHVVSEVALIIAPIWRVQVEQHYLPVAQMRDEQPDMAQFMQTSVLSSCFACCAGGRHTNDYRGLGTQRPPGVQRCECSVWCWTAAGAKGHLLLPGGIILASAIANCESGGEAALLQGAGHHLCALQVSRYQDA